MKIGEISAKSLPANAAVSPIVLSTPVSSLPGFTPAASAIAAASAASDVANAVPFTAAVTSSMTAPDSLADRPSPLNFACACSIASSRPKPFCRARPNVAPAAAPAPSAPFFRVDLIPLDSLEPIFEPCDVAFDSTPDNSWEIAAPIPFAEGMISTYAVARFVATMTSYTPRSFASSSAGTFVVPPIFFLSTPSSTPGRLMGFGNFRPFCPSGVLCQIRIRR